MDSSSWHDVARRAFFQLCLVPGIGPVLRNRLLEAFGDAESVLAQPITQLQQVPGMGRATAEAVARAREEIDLDMLLEECSRSSIDIVLEIDPHYPQRLREIPAPPGALFYRGVWQDPEPLAVAVVGTRQPTLYGRRQATRFATALAARGVTVISGLARGIDATAHRAVLEQNGRTIAVLGSGLLHVYPPEHDRLLEQIVEHGLAVSEYPPHRPPKSTSFPQRNRIISGLAWGVLVVEGSRRSGALVTARHALEQNREVMALPGPVDSGASAGCHRLLREGAQLVESPEEILELLGPLPQPAQHAGRTLLRPAELNLNEQEQAVLDSVGLQPTPIDGIIASSDLPAARVLATLTVLEMKRLIERVSGQFVVRR